MSTSSPSRPSFVDTHCHLDGDDFAHDLNEVIEQATEAGVSRWINVGYAPDRWQASIDLAATYPGMSYMLGVHPGHASAWNPGVEQELRRLIGDGNAVAIGEIGLDFYRGETNADEQIEAFIRQLAIAGEYNLPVAIHMRDAEDLVIETLDTEEVLPTLLFHSFDGSQRLSSWIRDHDAWIGVGGLATRKKSAELREQIAWIGLDRIVLETDSPYLVPNGFKHRRNTPASIPFIARTLADLFGSDVATIASRTSANADRLFWSTTPS